MSSAELEVSLTGANGDTITFQNQGSFVLTTGLAGFDIPQTNLRIDGSASDGGIFKFASRSVRILDLPIVILGDNRADVEAKLRRLGAMTQNGSGGTVIRVSYPTGETWELVGYYAGGAEGERGGESGGGNFTKWILTFHCPQPFWTRTTFETFTVRTGTTGRGLLETTSLSNLRVASAQAIGTLHVQSTGDVDSYPVWQLVGPMDSCTATRASDGASWAYTSAIAAGSTVTIDTFAGTVIDNTGANKYANLGASPKLFTVPSGISDITVVAPGSTSATQITLAYQPRKEVVH